MPKLELTLALVMTGLVTAGVLQQDSSGPAASFGGGDARLSRAAQSTGLDPAPRARAGQLPPEATPTGTRAPSGAKAFASELLRLSSDADVIDGLWAQYKLECDVRVGTRYDFGREWFALWDHQAQAAVQSPICQELLWRIGQEGERVRRDLLGACAFARGAGLDQATEVGVLRWNALQWR